MNTPNDRESGMSGEYGLTRRSFLAAGTAAAAGTVLGSSLATAAVKPAGNAATGAAGKPEQAPAAAPKAGGKRTLRKAVMYGMVQGGATPLEKLTILRDCGFDGVEVDGPTDIPAEQLLEAQEKTGIKIHGVVDSIHWAKPLNHPLEKVHAAGLAGLETALRDAKRYGATSVLLVPGVVNDELPYDECYTRSQAMIRKALPLAKELGVKIAIENVWNGFLLSPLEAAKYVDDFADPFVAFHFDIGNVINFGRPAQWVRILGKRICKLHIKDFSLKNRNDKGLWKGFDVQVGEGDAGWADVMRELDATGYSTAAPGNWATAEVGGGDVNRLKQIAGQMDRVLAM